MIDTNTVSSLIADADAFRQKIIDAGIRGKLTERLPEDGTAQELFVQIQEEKKRLVKEGKIKKQKPMPPIRPEDVPFEVPESWMWVRINDIFSVLNGDRGKNYPAKSSLTHSGIPFISAVNLDGQSIIKDDKLLCLSEVQYNKLRAGKLRLGDIVICIRGSLGKHGMYCYEKGAIASSLVICREIYKTDIIPIFLMLYLDTDLFQSQIMQYNNGTAQPNLAATSLEQFLFPLPPLAEQQRIAERIGEILDIQQELQASLESYTSDVSALKSKIINAGIQGRLTEQLPEDGSTQELFAQIQEEKKQLVKEGKIKKQKPMVPIRPEDVPFEVPKSWMWVRLGDIFDHNTGKTLNVSDKEGC